jgi:HEAT repeat protein
MSEKAGEIFIGSVLALTQDEDWRVRRAAAEALGQIGDQQAAERLLELLRDEDWDVRWAAARALWQISWKNEVPIRG